MTERSAAHTSFVLERDLPAPPARVFAAWADPEAKRRWADCHADAGPSDYSLDFRPGGNEFHRVVREDGATQVILKHFIDVVDGARIIFAYGIEVDGRRLSASLVTVEFAGGGRGTRMTYTEQLAYLDGHDDLAERIRGTAEGLDRLQLSLSA